MLSSYNFTTTQKPKCNNIDLIVANVWFLTYRISQEAERKVGSKESKSCIGVLIIKQIINILDVSIFLLIWVSASLVCCLLLPLAWNIYMSLALGKGGLIHVCKVSSQINLCSLHRLIKDNTFRFYCNFRIKEVSAKIQFRGNVSSLISGLHRLICDDTLGTCILCPVFHRASLVYMKLYVTWYLLHQWVELCSYLNVKKQF